MCIQCLHYIFVHQILQRVYVSIATEKRVIHKHFGFLKVSASSNLNHSCRYIFSFDIMPPVFWEVIVLVIVSKKVHEEMCLILNGYRDRAV
jgi:hypothetical protein